MNIPKEKYIDDNEKKDTKKLLSKEEDRVDYIQLNSEFYIKEAFLISSQKGCELLFKKYYASLCSHAVRYVYSKEVAEDIVSEVFKRFWEKKAFENVTSSYRYYLIKSVRNEAFLYLKKDFKQFDDLDGAERVFLESDSSMNPYNITLFEEIQHRLKNLVGQLPPQQKKAFILNRFEGKTYPEVAVEMGVSIKMIEAHIGKALFFIRNGLKEYLHLILIILFY